ncbi:protein TIC110, chloroplastic-like, partial [Salvia splendens]|uniref:protein TIC110, chloroplastic-like n=1 Tax=Salvia splendens TaxID=180675 RepID=UPI001C259861
LQPKLRHWQIHKFNSFENKPAFFTSSPLLFCKIKPRFNIVIAFAVAIDAEKARQVVHELAQARLSNSLIQAVALLRQRNNQGVVNSLNDLLACDKAVPATPVSWEMPEELADLFLVYLKSDQAPEKVARVQYLLNISDSTAESLQAMKYKGSSNGSAEQEEFVF